MKPPGAVFEVGRKGDTFIVTPVGDLSEMNYARIEQESREILEIFKRSRLKNLVLDFQRSRYYGSTALAFFVKLWRAVSAQDGKMALCNLSDHEREVLAVTRLDSLWPVCSSREEALEAVRGEVWVGP
jgi:anti-anti-sigma factor